MWWHKLITHWSKMDLASFSVLNWVLVFSLLIIVRAIQGRPVDLAYSTGFSFMMIPLSLGVLALFQRYSSRTEELSGYPMLESGDFEEDRLSREGRVLAFFYTEWCPFCRGSFHLLNCLNPDSSYRIFKVDLSADDNPLWDSLRIGRVPALIAFEEGKELWRREATISIGLRRSDFDKADYIMKTTN